MSPDTLTLWGLVLNLAGTITLAFNGFPQQVVLEPKKSYQIVYGEDPGYEEKLAAFRKKRRRQATIASVALAVVALGFLLQVVSVAL